MENGYREDLAYIHDSGFGDLARAAASVLLDALSARGVGGGLVIDLGCGSGILSEQLANHGYDVLGIDISAAHVALARRRVPRARFIVASLLTAELLPSVAVAAVGECFNYLFDSRHCPEAVRGVIDRIYEALAPGGPFIFDVAEPGRVPGPGPTKGHAEADGWAVLVTTEEDHEKQVLTRTITSFRKAGELYRRDHEVHRLRLLPRTQVLSWLQETGFEVQVLDGYGAIAFRPGWVGFLARKPR